MKCSCPGRGRIREKCPCSNSNLRTTFSGRCNFARCPLPFGYFQDISLTIPIPFEWRIQCSGKFSNVLHSNIINLVANDLAPTLTDWIVTTLYVCRIANALLPLLAFIAARLPESPSPSWGAELGVAAWRQWNQFQRNKLSNLWYKLPTLLPILFSIAALALFAVSWSVYRKSKYQNRQNSIRYLCTNRPYRMCNKSSCCNLLVTAESSH